MHTFRSQSLSFVGLILISLFYSLSFTCSQPEEILQANYFNSLHPENCVGAISYIQSVDDSVPGDLEVINVRTIGLKNVNVKRDLEGVEFPLELFTGDIMLPKELERVCKTLCPVLSNKIVVIMDRRIIRQSSDHEGIFLL